MIFPKRILSVLSVTLFALTAFATGNPPAKVYGMCNCQSKEKATPLIELSLQNDGTFNYIDNSNPVSSSHLKGSYEVKGSKIYLNSADGSTSFHRKWRYNKEGTCMKSRYKFNFRRICAVKPCELV